MSDKSTSESFLSRWSRRKQQSVVVTESNKQTPEAAEEIIPNTSAEEKKPDDLPIWQRQDVDPETKQQALKDLFRQPGFNQTDGLEEYENDYDYQSFAGLGSVVTHEMKRILERELTQDKTVDLSDTPHSAEESEQNEEIQPRNSRDEEDNSIA